MTQKNLRFAAWLTAFLLLMATCALAEPAAITPELYNPLNDLPLEYRNLRNLSDDMIRELRHGTFNSVGLLPLAEGTILLYGTFQYDDLVMELPHDGGFDRDLPRTDAYAIAVDENGERLWSLRLSDEAGQRSDGKWVYPVQLKTTGCKVNARDVWTLRFSLYDADTETFSPMEENGEIEVAFR